MSTETANSANSAENTDANLRTKRFSDTWRSKIRRDHNYAIEFAEGFFETAIEAEAEIDALRSRLAAAEAERDALRDRDREWFESVNRKLLIHQEFAKMRAAEPEVSFAHSHAAKILQQVIDDMENLHAHKTEGEA